jgi:beta-N-acetylhexosaminidase
MSTPILNGILRGELGFEGLLVSDDMEMKAVRGRYPLERQLREACEATMDLFLVCHTPELQQACFEALVRLQEDDPAQDRRAVESEKRLLAARERFFLDADPPPPLDVLACQEHADLVMAIRAVGEST